MIRRGWLVLCVLACLGLLPAVGHATRDPAGPPPQRMLWTYFADLNAHRFHAAWLLEAPCGVSYTVSNGPGAPVGSAGFAGRGKWLAPRGAALRHPILAAAHVTSIKRLHIAILDRNHIAAFAVSGWFRFDYSAAPYANDTHKTGHHMVKIAMWQCNGHWGVEPTYWESSGGGPLNWP